MEGEAKGWCGEELRGEESVDVSEAEAGLPSANGGSPVANPGGGGGEEGMGEVVVIWGGRGGFL